MGWSKEQEEGLASGEFPDVQSGQWVQPRRRGYLMMCCDCGLVHRFNFRLVKIDKLGRRKIQMQAFRVDD